MGGGWSQDSRAPPGSLVDVSPKVRAEARGTDEILGCVCMVVRMGKIEGASHGLKSDWVVVNVAWGERDGVGTFVCRPLGSRLNNV